MPAPVVAPSWSGFYIGGAVSERVSSVNWTTGGIGPLLGPADPATASQRFGTTSLRAGGFVGFNFQAGSFVFGIEGDGGYANNNQRHSGIPGAPAALTADNTEVKLTWDASIRGRIGFLVLPSVLWYGTGGAAFQNLQAQVGCPASPGGGSFCTAGAKGETVTQTRNGWTAGTGLEAMLSDYWTGRLEYRYADYGTPGHTFFAGTADQVASRLKLATHTVTIGIALKFGVGGS
jgi:outer membrane immunogenic protein